MGLKVQGTVEGYAEWAMLRFQEKSGKRPSSLLAMVVDRWLAKEDGAYLERYGISLSAYEEAQKKRTNVVEISRKR